MLCVLAVRNDHRWNVRKRLEPSSKFFKADGPVLRFYARRGTWFQRQGRNGLECPMQSQKTYNALPSYFQIATPVVSPSGDWTAQIGAPSQYFGYFGYATTKMCYRANQAVLSYEENCDIKWIFCPRPFHFSSTSTYCSKGFSLWTWRSSSVSPMWEHTWIDMKQSRDRCGGAIRTCALSMPCSVISNMLIWPLVTICIHTSSILRSCILTSAEQQRLRATRSNGHLCLIISFSSVGSNRIGGGSEDAAWGIINRRK